MNAIIVKENFLPDTVQDLNKFILIGTEKLVAMKAEIRAITKCNLAKEVYEQKMEEQRMLSELILDACVKVGEFTKTMSTASGIRTDLKPTDSGVARLCSKAQQISDLGFSPKQVQRFETLANNKDLVEQAKAEARENDDIPTRSRVLDLVRQRKLKEQEQAEKDTNYSDYIDSCKKIAVRFSNTISQVQSLDINDSNLKAWLELLDTTMLESERQKADEALTKIIKIQKFLKGVRL
ncbi:MAG: hypothetical protein ACYDG2_12205 [Ruminiclostridium sp.]